MVADDGSTHTDNSSKAPRFQEHNFKVWKKFFISFLMRMNRAHQVLINSYPQTIQDIDPNTPPSQTAMTSAQAKKLTKAQQDWETRNEVAYSYLMEVCNAHDKASTIAALYEGSNAKELLEILEERFLNIEKNTVQAELTKFNSMEIASFQDGPGFIDAIEKQAKVLETLGKPVTDDDKLTRLKEGLCDRRYMQLVHSMYTTPSLTYATACSLVKGYANTSFGKKAMRQASGNVEASREDGANIAETNNKAYNAKRQKVRCKKCNRLGHYAKECRSPQHITKDRHKKRYTQGRGDKFTPKCAACDKSGHKTKDCRLLEAFKKDKNKKRVADSISERRPLYNKKNK